MGKFIDMTGWIMREHGVIDSKLTVLYVYLNNTSRFKHWICQCECGNIVSIRGTSLRDGTTKSCGCLQKQIAQEIGWNNKKDLTGQRFGWLTVQGATEQRIKRQIVWDCLCDCGKHKNVQTDYLVSGRTTSCGCKKENSWRQDSLIGQKFNRLTVLEYILPQDRTNSNNSGACYLCECECGELTIVRASDLRRGTVKSCGCYNKEILINSYEDLTGKIFGKLTVEHLAGQIKSGNHSEKLWHCRCECGNECDIRRSSLMKGTKSCGCIKSYGEAIIRKILTDNNIKFIHDKPIFPDLVNDANHHLRYDFILFNEGNPNPYRLIEYDGEQHYKSVDWYNGEEGYKTRTQNDSVKNQYAQLHNIPLVRIPYWERDNITLEMIMGDKYLVKAA